MCLYRRLGGQGKADGIHSEWRWPGFQEWRQKTVILWASYDRSPHQNCSYGNRKWRQFNFEKKTQWQILRLSTDWGERTGRWSSSWSFHENETNGYLKCQKMWKWRQFGDDVWSSFLNRDSHQAIELVKNVDKTMHWRCFMKEQCTIRWKIKMKTRGWCCATNLSCWSQQLASLISVAWSPGWSASNPAPCWCFWRGSGRGPKCLWS